MPFSIPEAVPADGLAVTRTLIDTLIAQGQAVAKLIDQRLAQAQPSRATAFADPLPAEEPARTKEIARRTDVLRRSYVDAARALFGPAFVIVPLFRLHPDEANEVAQALAAPPADALAMEEWTHSAARVHPRLADLTWTMATTRWIERPIADPALAQLPHTPGAPWIGSAIGPDQARGEWLSLLVLEAAALAKSVRAGLMIDDWTETVPTTKETTGVAFNANRPNAVAPHAILAAVAPVLRGHWELGRSGRRGERGARPGQVRAVEPDQLLDRKPGEGPPHGDYFQAVPAILSEFTTARFAHVHFAAVAVRGPARTEGADHGRRPSVSPRSTISRSRRVIRSRSYRGWNRLEGRPRSADFERNLRAEARDPLWFLTRQWQFGEFEGDDAGSPIDARIAYDDRAARSVIGSRHRHSALRRARRRSRSRVEQEAVPFDLMLHMQAARVFERLLGRARQSAARLRRRSSRSTR